MPPLVPYLLLAITFGYCSVLGVIIVVKHKDFTVLSLLPSFVYMTLYYCSAPYLNLFLSRLWHDWGMLGLSLSFLALLVWRQLFLFRGAKWKR